jgi:hypothetical protein
LCIAAVRWRAAQEGLLTSANTRGDRGATSDAVAFYQVTTAAGEAHVEQVSAADPAAILARAAAFGPGATVQRIDARQAHELTAGKQVALSWLGLLFVLPAGLLGAGVLARRRVAHAEAVLGVLRKQPSQGADEVMAAVGIPRAELERVVASLRRRKVMALNWDPKTDRIFDTRLSRYNITLPFCPRCNSQLNLHVKADLNVLPSCPDCLAPVDRFQLRAQVSELVERLRHDAAAVAAIEPSFSLVRFALWTLAFPPMAAWYALSTTD